MKLKTKSTSFWNEIMKGQKWAILVLSLIVFAAYPISFIINMNANFESGTEIELIRANLNNYFMYSDTYSNIHSFSYFGNCLLYLSMLIGGVSGIAAYKYLHNHTQVGMLHSIPISRTKMLNTKFSTATVTYVLPLLVGHVLVGVLYASREFLTTEIFLKLIIFFCYNVLSYWMGYLVSAIAMLLTGKIFIGVFGAFVISLYAPGFAMLLTGLMGYFINNIYWTYSYNVDSVLGWLYRISPVYYLQVIEWNVGGYFIKTILILIFLWFVHYFLMKIRPSEAAGKSIAYKKAGDIIKVFIVVFGGIGIGTLFYEFSVYHLPWLYFGIAFGIFVTYIIMQLLYGVEFRELFHEKIQLLVITIISYVIVLFFVFDINGYDNYIPNYDEIADINIEFNEVNTYTNYILPTGIYDIHMGKTQETYELVNACVESAEQVVKDDFRYVDETMYIYVEYILNSGKKVEREYEVYIEDVIEQLPVLWENEEFLNVMYPIRLFEVEEVSYISFRDIYDSEMFDYAIEFTNEDEINEFLSVYKEDLENIEGSDIYNSEILAYVDYNVNIVNEVESTYYYKTFYIYPCLTETINYFRDKGYELNGTWQVEDVESIMIESPEGITEYTQVEDMADILPELIYYRNISIFTDVEEDTYVEIMFQGDSYYKSAYLLK